jgi:hypothetical protein
MHERSLDVAIVGAGVHACVVAVRLLHEWPALRATLRLVDPSGRCLDDWARRARGQGMDAMRSSGAHHLDVAATSLLDYARAHGREAELAPPYARPSLALFMDHSRWVIECARLEALVTPTTVVDVERTTGGYRLHGADGTTIRARTLVLAPGLSGHERVPAWVRELARDAPDAVAHVESLDLPAEAVAGEHVLVIGGGLSAATLANAAVVRGAAVTLASRHPLEARLFDADPGWVGPKYLSLFQREPDPDARVRMIRRARGRGSVTPELLASVRHHEREGRLRVLEGREVRAARYRARDRAITVRFDDGGTLDAHRAWSCTGFAPDVRRLEWLGALRGAAHCDGRPLVGSTLELAPDCFVTGWLAELWVGPAARNISGARHAARVIVETLRGRGVAAAA